MQLSVSAKYFLGPPPTAFYWVGVGDSDVILLRNLTPPLTVKIEGSHKN